MNIHEQKKTCKIIDEFVLYLMRKGQKKVNVDINLDNENETIIKVKTNNLKPEVIDKLMKYINQERELEIEEYGWELMGESDVSNELELVGLLIDRLDIEFEGENCILILRRKH